MIAPRRSLSRPIFAGIGSLIVLRREAHGAAQISYRRRCGTSRKPAAPGMSALCCVQACNLRALQVVAASETCNVLSLLFPGRNQTSSPQELQEPGPAHGLLARLHITLQPMHLRPLVEVQQIIRYCTGGAYGRESLPP